MDYAQSIANHRAIQGTGDFQNGATTGTSYADFDQSYSAINGSNYQPTASSYTVQAGDTLQTIAYQLWGDSSFWYLIADANGLNSGSTLVAGQTLSIPNKVHNIHNSVDTYRVYDPNKAQGNLQPIPPKNPSSDGGGGCGILGEIFLVIIAVVVSVLTYGALSGPMVGLLGSTFGTLAAGAVAGVAGSIVSQGVGLATGLQSKFDWGAVGTAAIGGMVGAGLAPGGIFGADGAFSSLGEFGGAVARGVVGNIVSQGIDVATGLQSKFDWAGVAAAGVGAGVGYEAGGALGIEPTANADGSYTYNGPATDSMDYAWRAGVSGMAGAIAGAGARSLANGSDFGDNIMAALPDVIGQTIGNMLIDEINQPSGYQIQPMPIDASQPITGGPSLQLQMPTLPDMSAYASAADSESAGAPPGFFGRLFGGNNTAPAVNGTMNLTINGVSDLTVIQMQPGDTGATGVGNVQDVENQLGLLSSEALTQLEGGGVQWIVVPNSADQAFPNEDLTAISPRGWPANTDFGDVGGMFFPANSTYNSSDYQDVVIGTSGLDGSFNVALHETGHAWDAINGDASQQAAFLAAYNNDVPLMTTAQEAQAQGNPNNSDAYYLQGRDSNGVYVGAQEAYAESFARFVGGDSTLQQDWPAMYKYWNDINGQTPIKKY